VVHAMLANAIATPTRAVRRAIVKRRVIRGPPIATICARNGALVFSSRLSQTALQR
jgi:hypothetical protein